MRDLNDYSDKYVAEPFESTIVKIRKKLVMEQCDKYPHKNIIEIGCGMNPFFLDYKDFENMIIVEPSLLFAENAKKLSKFEEKKITVIQSFFEEAVASIKDTNLEVDYIILSSVLHELEEPQKMLSAIKSICDENTIIHINVPNANSLHRLIAKEAGIIKDVHEQSLQMQKMQRQRTYDMDLLLEEVHQTGFKVAEKGSYFIKPFTHMQMQECLDEGIINEQVLVGLERIIKYLPDYGAGIYVNVSL